MKRSIVLGPIVLLIVTACQTPTPSTPIAQATATPRPIVQAATSSAAPPSPTIAPTNTVVDSVTIDSATITWSPVTYTSDGGHYIVSYRVVGGEVAVLNQKFQGVYNGQILRKK